MTKVTVFTTRGCPYCQCAKDILNKKNIPFQEANLENNPEVAKLIVEKMGMLAVPVTVVENDGKEEIIMGCDKEKLNNIIS